MDEKVKKNNSFFKKQLKIVLTHFNCFLNRKHCKFLPALPGREGGVVTECCVRPCKQ